MEHNKLFRGQVLSPITEEQYTFLPDGGLVVDADGIILDVGNYEEIAQRYAETTVIDLADSLLLPGFVDTHVHLPQYGAVALYGKELLDWLDTYIFPAERAFTAEMANTLCPIFFRSLLAYGTTTAAVYCSIQKESTHVAFEWARETGLRAIIGKVMMDRNSPGFLLEKTTESLRASEELCRTWHGTENGRLLYAFSPRFAPTCSRALMKAASELASQYGAYIQTHLAENLAEVEWVRELFPEARSYTDVYFSNGLLGPKSILAHAIHLDPDERHLLRDTDTCLSHCPTSNLFLHSGLMPLRELMDEGLRIGLGTDVGGGPTLSLFTVMRAAIYVHNARRFLPQFSGGKMLPSHAFYLATLGGAKALGLHKRIGSLDPGKEADFIVVNPQKLSPLSRGTETALSPETVLSRLVFRGDDRIVEQTYVRGRCCYDQTQGDRAQAGENC